jgi:hypothetical protein
MKKNLTIMQNSLDINEKSIKLTGPMKQQDQW